MVRAFAGMLATAVVVGFASNPRVKDKYLEPIKVSDNVYVFKPKIDWTHGNGVAIVGPDGVFFVDTYIQFNYAEEAIRRLRKITSLPVRYVLNTHWHFDHVMGNSVFKRVFPGEPDHRARFDGRDARPPSQGPSRRRGGFHQRKHCANGQRGHEWQDEPGNPTQGHIKPYWDLSLQEAREYQQQFMPEKSVGADITCSDTLTIHWGAQTLRLIHMADGGHSAGDVVVWIPETRIRVAGDLVVAPTAYATYYNSPGMVKAIHALIAMNPAVVIPGHGFYRVRPELHGPSGARVSRRIAALPRRRLPRTYWNVRHSTASRSRRSIGYSPATTR